MIHKIRAAFGNSYITYGGDDVGDWWSYPQGVLQYNVCCPAIWIALSSVVFKLLHRSDFGVDITSTISKEIVEIVEFAYVDDCDLIQPGSNLLIVL